MNPENKEIGYFFIACGGPFYKLQRKLGLLREDEFHSKPRAVMFVALTWGVPLVLNLITGSAYGPFADKPFLLDAGAWARYFIAVSLFILMEKQVQDRLKMHLAQFTRAPLLAPGSFEAAAEAVTRALNRRDALLAEIICILIAIILTLIMWLRLLNQETSFWAVNIIQDANSLTLAGWWVVVVSSPVFLFLLLRWLWRIAVWSMLLRELAGFELRLVATHPDGHGGLTFLGQYPNAFTMFVFAISCVVGAAIAHELMDHTVSMTTYGYLMGGWLLIIMLLFSYPLAAFHKPLTDLKERTLLLCSSQATRHHRAAERELLGKNISATGDAELVSAKEIPDPSKTLTSVLKLSTFLFNREGLLPVSGAALLPLVTAGATQLPIKEIFKVMKRLLLL